MCFGSIKKKKGRTQNSDAASEYLAAQNLMPAGDSFTCCTNSIRLRACVPTARRFTLVADGSGTHGKAWKAASQQPCFKRAGKM